MKAEYILIFYVHVHVTFGFASSENFHHENNKTKKGNTQNVQRKENQTKK